MDNAIYVAALGCVGGAVPDVLRLIEGRHGQAPSYLSSLYFWISLVLLVALGGAAAYVGTLGGQNANAMTALAFGYSAPSVLSKLLSDPSTRSAERSLSSRRSLRSWWAA